MRHFNNRAFVLRTSALLAAVVAIGFGQLAAASDGAAENAVLRFCVCTDAMPRAGRASSGAPQGVDVAVAELLARSLHRRSEFHWCPADACRLRNLEERRCDVVLGLPKESVSSRDLVWLAPYASGKFGLLTSPGAQAFHSLAELRGKRVGVVSGTVPLNSQDHVIVQFPSRQALLSGFQAARLDGALVDADYAAWYLHEHPRLDLRLVDEFVSQYRWSIGVAVRVSDTKLRDEIARAVEASLQRAEFTPLFAKYGLVHRAPLVDAPKTENVSHTWQRIREGHPLTISLDPANLPYSSADPKLPGFDAEIAQALAKQLGVEVQLKWMDVHRDTPIGQLLEGECDLALGAAIDPNAMDDEQELAGKVIYSRPYIGTGYFLVARKDAPPVKSLAELRGEKSSRLGTQAGSVADYTLRQRGYHRRLFGTQLAVLKSLDDGGIDYGYLWSNAGWLIHTSPDTKVVLVDDYVPEDRWNIAIAMRRGDAELKEHVDRALDAIVEQGIVAGALERYHTPYFAPFDSASEDKPSSADAGKKTDGAVDAQAALARPINRGLEPQMARRQRSKQSYHGLSMVRSRGTLIVGLDQSNLPFSTAHPVPAGLDYEIAQLLADELGVSLQVYWAYSSHDSYPSKLANKKLCDIILGVMPDDRFANEVSFSDPYYEANYQFVMAAGATSAGIDSASLSEPVAVEAGVAVKGLEGRELRRLPSLEAVLAAVAEGREKVGYVVSCRAHWLAEQSWQNKLRFIRPDSTADRFPICAAVRREDSDLKAALNDALRQLHESGRLDEAFARWHVPLDRFSSTDESAK